MPISLPIPIRRLSQQEFGDLSFAIMRHVFAIHNEMGRFFDEKIYKRELTHRVPDARLEIPIDITFDSFQKRYFMDVLVGDGALFEFKAVDALAGRHRAQVLNYLLLSGLAHAKLINVRTEDVQHEFVNSSAEHADRIRFEIDCARWNTALPGAARLYDVLTTFLRDVGTGLEIALYEDAAAHFFGGPAQMEADVGVTRDGHALGHQRVRLIGSGVALKITALDGTMLRAYEGNAHPFLQHTDLRAIAWVNVTMKKVTFATLEK